MLNGALMGIGAAAVVDTVVFYWVLDWHRLIEGAPDPELFFLELVVVLVGAIPFAVGAPRERRARRR